MPLGEYYSLFNALKLGYYPNLRALNKLEYSQKCLTRLKMLSGAEH